MNLLADENIDGAIVRWLREQGSDVLWAAETARATSDPVLLAMAREQSRVLLTSDLDFGQMVFRQRLGSAGIVLLRFRVPAEEE